MRTFFSKIMKIVLLMGITSTLALPVAAHAQMRRWGGWRPMPPPCYGCAVVAGMAMGMAMSEMANQPPPPVYYQPQMPMYPQAMPMYQQGMPMQQCSDGLQYGGPGYVVKNVCPTYLPGGTGKIGGGYWIVCPTPAFYPNACRTIFKPE